jgi:hypothetical protein
MRRASLERCLLGGSHSLEWRLQAVSRLAYMAATYTFLKYAQARYMS